jgi:hypothetical protein
MTLFVGRKCLMGLLASALDWEGRGVVLSRTPSHRG